MSFSIKNLKSVFYRKETGLNEEYDPALGFQEISVFDLTQDSKKDKFETTYLNKTRQLNTSTASGRSKGTLTFNKNVDTSLLLNHKDLIKAGLGDVIDGAAASTITSITAFNIVVATGTYAAGDFVVLYSNINKYISPIFRVSSFNSGTSTIQIGLVDEDILLSVSAKLGTLSADTKVKKVNQVKIASPVQGSTFTFVVEYQNSIVEVYRGCGVSCGLEINTDGKAQISFNIQSAKVSNIDYTGTLYGAVTGTITPETNSKPIKYDFQQSSIFDVIGEEDLYNVFPQSLSLTIGHSLEENINIGGLNNVRGYYTKPSVEAEANWHYTAANIYLFSEQTEGLPNRTYYCSQSNFALWVPYANFTIANPADMGEYDSINTYMELNSLGQKEPVISLPEITLV